MTFFMDGPFMDHTLAHLHAQTPPRSRTYKYTVERDGNQSLYKPILLKADVFPFIFVLVV